jgi:hypothetical protein
MVGYWDATNPAAPKLAIHNGHALSYWDSVCATLKSNGIIPIAWIEGGVSWGESKGTPDIRAANYAAYQSVITSVVSHGFSGYSDDIEGWAGQSVTDKIAYLNALTPFLHGLNQLNMPAVASNTGGGGDYNQHLKVDYILSMFYWASSLLEDSSASAYWQEEFGLGAYSSFGTPASPIIIGISNQGNSHNYAWQLGAGQNTGVTQMLNTYGSSNLKGICIWCVDNLSSTDWNAWNTWYNTWNGYFA